MKRRITMSAWLTLAVAVVFSTAALAQHGDRGGPGGPGVGRGEFPPPGGPMGGPGDEFGPPGGPPGPPPGMRPPSPEELERAGVTAAQRAKIEALHDDAMRRRIRLGADVRIAELDLRKEIESDAPDTGAVEAAIERVGQLRTAMHKAHVMEMLAVRAVLTPEQRAKLKKSRAPMGGH
jgi:Spy/CpxP family protein refolding chaperone